MFSSVVEWSGRGGYCLPRMWAQSRFMVIALDRWVVVILLSILCIRVDGG